VGAYVARRIASGLGLLLALTVLAYAIVFTIPADPGYFIVKTNHPTPAEVRKADHELGVDRPVYVQYGKFLWRLAHGDLGNSYASGAPVLSIVRSSLPVTASIVLGGAVLLSAAALALGILCARRPHTAVDRIVATLPLVGIALHPLAVGLILRSVFAKHVHLAPVGGYCGPLSGSGGCGGVSAWTAHLILPWITFALFLLPLYVRMVRTRVLETLDEQHVTVARAKGASERRVVSGHVLPLVFPSLVAMLAMDAGTALTAAIYIEVAFSLPGLGQTALQAQQGTVGLDLPVITGVIMVVAAAVIVLNVMADIAAARLDPRLELGARRSSVLR
jgi:peptide/nickel transport system permease protein